MEIICAICVNPLKEPGAVIISPPTETYHDHSIVEKFHVCVDCWDVFFTTKHIEQEKTESHE